MPTVQTLLICNASLDGGTVAPCPSGTAPSTVQALVLEPSQAPHFEPFDPALGSEYWFLGFGFVLGLHLTAKGLAVLVNLLR